MFTGFELSTFTEGSGDIARKSIIFMIKHNKICEIIDVNCLLAAGLKEYNLKIKGNIWNILKRALFHSILREYALK